MKNVIKYILAVAVAAAALAGCSKKEPIVGTQDKDGFFINRTELSLNKGTTGTLVSTVTPKGAGSGSWSTSDPAIATVEDGVVTAVGGGEAVISAKYGSQELTCTVFVSALVTSVTLDNHSVEFDKGDTQQLSYVIGPEDVNVDLDIEWSSSDEAVLKVDENGLVTAVGGGRASIAVKVNGVTDVCEFFSHCYPTGIAITPASAEVNVNETTQFTASLLPADVTEELAFEWSVEDPSLASVDENGVVSGIASGETKVIVKAGDFTAEATLTVKRPIVTVTVKPSSTNYVDGLVTFNFAPTCYYYSSFYGMEVPARSNFTVSVAAGYELLKISFAPSYNGNRGDFTPSTGTYTRTGSNHTWEATETTSSVTFDNQNSFEFDIAQFTITYQ